MQILKVCSTPENPSQRMPPLLGARTAPDEVIITAGASEGADLVLTELVGDSDEVLLPAPGYPLYPAILNKLGANARYYNLDRNKGWRPSVDEVRSLISKNTRALVLINPNNPTGSITPDETTREFLKIASAHNLLVISDEVYRDLCFGEQPISASLMAEAFDHTCHHVGEPIEDAYVVRLASWLDALYQHGPDAGPHFGDYSA